MVHWKATSRKWQSFTALGPEGLHCSWPPLHATRPVSPQRPDYPPGKADPTSGNWPLTSLPTCIKGALCWTCTKWNSLLPHQVLCSSKIPSISCQVRNASTVLDVFAFLTIHMKPFTWAQIPLKMSSSPKSTITALA